MRIEFNLDDGLIRKFLDYRVRNEPFPKLSKDENLNKLVSLGLEVLEVLEEAEKFKQITKELEHNNLAIDEEDIVGELPVRVNIKLDQLKKFIDMAEKENLPINKLMSVVLNEYINHYHYVKRKLCKEDMVSFKKSAIEKIAIFTS
jgi:hypothetical protein